MKTKLFNTISISLAAGAFLVAVLSIAPGQAHAQYYYGGSYYSNPAYNTYGYNNGYMNYNHCVYTCYQPQYQYPVTTYYYYPVYYYTQPVYYYPTYPVYSYSYPSYPYYHY